MTGQQTDGRIQERGGSGTALKRRGILAAAGAAMAGIVAKQASQPVAAASAPVTYATDTNGSPINQVKSAVVIDDAVGFNSAPGTRLLSVRASATSGIGAVYGAAITAYGLHGEISQFAGGVANPATNTNAVEGVNLASGTGGTGVYGRTVAGVYGVYGLSSSAGGAGVRGDCAGGTGVLGSVTDGYGVLGQGDTGNGVRGFSQQNHAIVGQTAKAYYGGVFGVATLDNTVGIYGSTFNGATRNANAFAGYMDGNFVVANGVKSAAVKHTDGSHRLVYCMESPENWFEDFGEGKLVAGKADVKLDPDFAAIVDASAYHVFIAPRGDCKGLYTSAHTAAGFSVREVQGGTSSLAFSYRIVAKRKDIAAARLARFDLPGKAKVDVAVPKAPPPPATG